MLRWAQAYFTGKFFCPDKEFVASNSPLPLSYENVAFSSKSGRPLYGFFLKAKGNASGTVVHCHGNRGTIHDHVPLVQFLVEQGFNVLVFDYGGYGRSVGHPSPESIVDDARAALAYCRSRGDVDKKKIALFGQSLGGVAATGAMAAEKDVRCLILEGTFTTYRSMAWQTSLGQWLFMLTPFVIPNTGPVRDLENIEKRPVLIVHGEKDDVVPVRFSKELHRKNPANTTLIVLKNLGHLEGAELEPRYQLEIKEFLKRSL